MCRIFWCTSEFLILMTCITLFFEMCKWSWQLDCWNTRFAAVIMVTLLFFVFTSLLFFCVCSIISHGVTTWPPVISISIDRAAGEGQSCGTKYRAFAHMPWDCITLPWGTGNGNKAQIATRFRRRPSGLIRTPPWKTHYWAESSCYCACGKTSFIVEKY